MLGIELFWNLAPEKEIDKGQSWCGNIFYWIAFIKSLTTLSLEPLIWGLKVLSQNRMKVCRQHHTEP